MNPGEIQDLARRHGYELEQYQKEISLLIFIKGRNQVNVYHSKMTVGTCVNHPTKGKTQLFRKRVSPEELERIFRKPRVHTGKGYYRR